MTSRRNDLKHRHRLVLDTTAKLSGNDFPEHLVVVPVVTGGCTPILPASIAALRRQRSTWCANRSGRHVNTPWCEDG
jgi:hypothetical protein